MIIPQEASKSGTYNSLQNIGNVTVFIHGFNVPEGEFGRYIDDIKIVTPPEPQGPEFSGSNQTPIDDAQAVIADAVCTLWRDPKNFKKQFPQFDPATQTNLDQWLSDNPREGTGKLNGTGAQRWLVNMENNINRAAGFDGMHYDKYNRIVLVEWSGDVPAANYMEAVRRTTNAAQKLTQLLQQLIEANLSVNIIAHSLGNAVLLTALNNLGMYPMDAYTNKINHVFLWEPAVPNNALSDRKINEYPGGYAAQRKYAAEQLKKDRWFLPYAHRVPKKITVLYSENDNILGPIPDTQPPGVTQEEVNKHKPFAELIAGLLITRLGLHGLYQMAMWVGVPVTDLLHSANQESFYQKWIKGRTRKMALDPTTGRYQWAPISSQFFYTQDIPYPDTLEEFVNEDAPEQQAFYDQLRQRLEANETDINQQIQAAGYANKIPELIFEEWIAEGLILLLDNTLRIAKRAWALATMVLYDLPLKEPVAMGYTGPDKATVQQLGKKLTIVDQKPWLFSHSGMMVPTKDLMEHVYIDRILKAEGYYFGQYPTPK